MKEATAKKCISSLKLACDLQIFPVGFKVYYKETILYTAVV
jgi:hypothetical protein